NLPEVPLRAPEAAHAEDRRLGALGPGRLERRAIDEVRRRATDLGLPPGQRRLGGRDVELVGEAGEEHGFSLLVPSRPAARCYNGRRDVARTAARAQPAPVNSATDRPACARAARTR